MIEPTTIAPAKAKKRLSGWHWLILFLVLASLVGWFGFHLMDLEIDRDVVESTKEADAGFSKAKATIDPEFLRTWALKEISEYPVTNATGDGRIISLSEIPDKVLSLYPVSPGDATVANDGGQTYVHIGWGGGMFHWEIAIGSTNFSENTGAANDYTTAKWVDGIYYSREDTTHPIK